MTTVIETCRISPPAEVSVELQVPLSFFDILWLHYHPIHFLLFYEYPCSEASFLDSLVPKLKDSLSLTLGHYLLVAGNLVCPSETTEKPVLRYATGDSVRLTIAKSTKDFGELTGNHARDADQFYDFVPSIPSPDPEHGTVLIPLLALQVTLFPGRGICVGLAFHHCLGDASSFQRFLLAWASVHKDGGELSLPIFNRSVIHDIYGVDDVFWQVVRNIPLDPAPSFPIPTNRVRARFTLRRDHINNLKAKKPGASSFVVTTSYVWSCLAKSETVEDESHLFIFLADARRLINPAVPANYFGTCLTAGVVILEHKKLAGDEGFVTAAQEIADAIKEEVNANKDEFVKRAKDWTSRRRELEGFRTTTSVSGSPKFDFGAADFGWGKLRSQELVSMDQEKYSMFLSNSVDEEGGLDVGLSLPRENMEAFAASFADGLKL